MAQDHEEAQAAYQHNLGHLGGGTRPNVISSAVDFNPEDLNTRCAEEVTRVLNPFTKGGMSSAHWVVSMFFGLLSREDMVTEIDSVR